MTTPETTKTEPKSEQSVNGSEGKDQDKVKKVDTLAEKFVKFFSSTEGILTGILGGVGLAVSGVAIAEYFDAFDSAKDPFGITTFDEFQWRQEQLPDGTDVGNGFFENLEKWQQSSTPKLETEWRSQLADREEPEEEGR